MSTSRTQDEALAPLIEHIEAGSSDAAADALRDVLTGNLPPDAARAASAWAALGSFARAIEALRAHPELRQLLRKKAPSHYPELKILWVLAEEGRKEPTPRPKRASRTKQAKAQKAMDTPQKVGDFVRRLQASKPVDDDRRALLGELRSEAAGVTRDEMVAIAKGLIGRSYRTKKDALTAIEDWFHQRVRMHREAALITRAGAR